MKDHICTRCGDVHVVAKVHKETLSKIKCEMLKRAAAYVMFTGKNDFKKSEVPGMADNSAYGNFQKLRYHGLAVQVHVNGVKQRDRWLITRNGWAFLRGELKLPKYVMVKDNHPLIGGRSDALVSLLDVLKGGEYLETRFEYFDEETGAMIGLRPAAEAYTRTEPLKQVSML